MGRVKGSNSCSKVDVPYLVLSLDWTSLFEWYVVRCDSKNKDKKDKKDKVFKIDWIYNNHYKLTEIYMIT